jgi:CRP-like cAMP-binding protein
MHPILFKNTILQRLDLATIARLDLRPVTLERNHVLETPGDEIKNLFFIEEGIGSMTNMFKDGSQVEVGMFGCESVIGASRLLGTRRSLNHIYMQLAGRGYASQAETAEREFRRFEYFHELVLRYTQAQLMQTAQSAGCNARHEVHQRLARWLLLCHDRASSDVMDLTQEFLAHMLGVTRPSVSVVAEQLQNDGIIEYSRGKVRVVDRTALEAISCECYKVVHDHLNSYADVETGFG